MFYFSHLHKGSSVWPYCRSDFLTWGHQFVPGSLWEEGTHNHRQQQNILSTVIMAVQTCTQYSDINPQKPRQWWIWHERSGQLISCSWSVSLHPKFHEYNWKSRIVLNTCTISVLCRCSLLNGEWLHYALFLWVWKRIWLKLSAVGRQWDIVCKGHGNVGGLTYQGSEKTQLTSKIWELDDLSPKEKWKNFYYRCSQEFEAPAV